MITDIGAATKVVQQLFSSGSWVKTKRLLLMMKGKWVGEFEKYDHLTFRENILKKLYKAGAIERVGSGSFSWRYNVKATVEYNPMNPFKKLSCAPVQSEVKPTYTKWKEKTPMAWSGPINPFTPVDPIDMTIVDDITEDQKDLELIIAKEIQDDLDKLKNKVKELEKKIEKQDETIEELHYIAKSHVKVLEVKHYLGKAIKLKDKVLPKVFDQVFNLAKCRRNILLVGPAGAGKSYLAKLIAETMMLDFGSISCTAGMSETHLLGRSIPDLTHGKSKFQGTEFLNCYESGGVFLLDELDASDPNLLLCVNTALANNYCNVPNRQEKPKATQHEDFVCVATANTYGKGASRQYAGRNQLDEATLDRFRIGLVEMDYDIGVETALCPDDDFRNVCYGIRERIQEAGLRRVMSSRFMKDAYVMMKEAKWTKELCLEVFFSGWSPEERAKVYQ